MDLLKKIYCFLFVYDYRTNILINLYVKNKNNRILYLLLEKKLRKKSIIIGKNSEIGENIKFPHPQNIVIGQEVKIGHNCKIYHDVTLGQNLNKYPILGDNVIIYPGAKIFGNITIGNNVIIGANSVVTKSIPDNSIVAGNPAKIIKSRGDKDEFY